MLSAPSTTNASHVTIVISGFLSQDKDKKSQWDGVTKHLNGHSSTSKIFDTNTAVYGLTWESKSEVELKEGVTGSLANAAKYIFSSKGNIVSNFYWWVAESAYNLVGSVKD